MLTNVQRIVSPAIDGHRRRAAGIRALGARRCSPSVQAAVSVSVIVFSPNCEALKVNVLVLDGVPSASSSSEKALKPLPVVVNAKSCASLGCASLTIVKVASFLFV